MTLIDADWHGLVDEEEAFYLRVAGPGDYRYKGADLGVLVARGRMQTSDLRLTERCHRWVEAIRHEFEGVPVEPDETPIDRGPFAFKAPVDELAT